MRTVSKLFKAFNILWIVCALAFGAQATAGSSLVQKVFGSLGE